VLIGIDWDDDNDDDDTATNDDNDNGLSGTQHSHPRRRQRRVWPNGQPVSVTTTLGMACFFVAGMAPATKTTTGAGGC
jgi:hypothetical protein